MKISAKDVVVPLDVPEESKDEYVKNYLKITHNTGRLMLFAGDQKIEHLNDDYFGENKLGKIPLECNDPEHMFKIASQSLVGCFVSQLGLIARYGQSYPKIPYLAKLNSKSDLVKTQQKDPISGQLWDVDDVLVLKKNGLNIFAVGYTVYLGSEFESDMLTEAAQIVSHAHEHGLITVLWMYPRGQAVKDEKDPHLVAGAAGVGACLGADFVKVNYSKADNSAEAFKEAVQAAGRTKVITSGGSSKNPKEFLEDLYAQLNISGASGNATGRNIHQKKLDESVRMANAIASLTLGGKDVKFAYDVYLGKQKFRLE